jgi:hypothetical protein
MDHGSLVMYLATKKVRIQLGGREQNNRIEKYHDKFSTEINDPDFIREIEWGANPVY